MCRWVCTWVQVCVGTDVGVGAEMRMAMSTQMY